MSVIDEVVRRIISYKFNISVTMSTAHKLIQEIVSLQAIGHLKNMLLTEETIL